MLRLTNLLTDLVDKSNDGLVHIMALVNCLDHLLLRNHIGSGLDHDNLGGGRSYGKLKISIVPILLGWIHNKLSVLHTHLGHGTGTIEGNIGNSGSKCSSDHGYQLRTALRVYRHNHIVQSNVIAVILRKQRSHGTVNHAGGKNGILRSLPLTLVKTSRNFANGIHFLLELNTEGEEIDSVSWLI